MSGYDEALLKRAQALHDAPNVTMDGHNDLPWALHDAYDHRLAKFDLSEPQGHIKIPKLRHQYLHTDFPRCRKGGLTAQFWSVYVPTTIRGGEARAEDSGADRLPACRKGGDGVPGPGEFDAASYAFACPRRWRPQKTRSRSMLRP